MRCVHDILTFVEVVTFDHCLICIVVLRIDIVDVTGFVGQFVAHGFALVRGSAKGRAVVDREATREIFQGVKLQLEVSSSTEMTSEARCWRTVIARVFFFLFQ